MSYVPKTKSEFYDILGWMILECPDYRSPIRGNDLGIEGAFNRLDNAIAILYKNESDPIRQQLLRMSAEAQHFSEAALVRRKNERGKSNALAAREIFVDMEWLMKGKPLLHWQE